MRVLSLYVQRQFLELFLLCCLPSSLPYCTLEALLTKSFNVPRTLCPETQGL